MQPIIQAALAKREGTVVDRYIYSTFAMHAALGVDTLSVKNA